MEARSVAMAARLSSIGFLGSGKMATAMARGFISAGEHSKLHYIGSYALKIITSTVFNNPGNTTPHTYTTRHMRSCAHQYFNIQ